MPQNETQEGEQDTETVTLFKQGNQVLGISPVNDYIFRPIELESVSLYDWIA